MLSTFSHIKEFIPFIAKYIKSYVNFIDIVAWNRSVGVKPGFINQISRQRYLQSRWLTDYRKNMVTKVSDLQTPEQKRRARKIYPSVVMKYVTAGGLRKALYIIFYMINSRKECRRLFLSCVRHFLLCFKLFQRKRVFVVRLH